MKLKPVEVPWKISSCDEIAEFEYDINLPYAYITIQCSINHFEHERQMNEYIKKNGEIPDNIANAMGIKLVKLKFDEVHLLNIINLYSDTLQTEKRYDCSLIPSFGFDFERYHKVWDEEGNCPDPEIYTVIDSKYFDFFNINTSDLTHWLITVGATAQEVHVIAKKFSWELMECKFS